MQVEEHKQNSWMLEQLPSDFYYHRLACGCRSRNVIKIAQKHNKSSIQITSIRWRLFKVYSKSRAKLFAIVNMHNLSELVLISNLLTATTVSSMDSLIFWSICWDSFRYKISLTADFCWKGIQVIFSGVKIINKC